jgi:predicted O-linked N-acetylglucosamine transferase (SPINDLY family)
MIAVVIPGSPKSGNQEILDARRAYAADIPAPRAALKRPPAGGRAAHAKLRVGYVSSFFQRPNWMKPVWGLINQHDRERFEIHLFSDAPATAIASGYRTCPEDHYHNTTRLSNEEMAALIEASEIDLLVDLNGYSNMQRLPLYALKPAPVIAGWFNLYASTGLACLDYLIGDEEVIPAEEEQFYGEKIRRVPGSCLTFEVGYAVPPVAAPPCLSRPAVTFGCLASQYKITSEVIAAWSRILAQAPRSTLLVKNATLGPAGNRRFVHERFREHGIAPERVRLEGGAEHYDFLKRYDGIDAALDTFPYNGGTTTTEAIWQGVPVIAFAGDRWAARTSASILRAGGLGEFVGRGLEEYVSLAIALARSPETPARLEELRRTMRARLAASPVCDTRAFAREMEQLYERMTEDPGARASER